MVGRVGRRVPGIFRLLNSSVVFGAIVSAGLPQESPRCVGEYVEAQGPAGTECTLAANGGYVDEPTGRYTSPRPTKDCDLSGSWSCGGVDCVINTTSTTAFTVVALEHWAWVSARGRMDSSGDVALTFNMTTHTLAYRNATCDRFCCTLAMSDGSTWTRVNCPSMPVFDVHIVAHTHDDTGYLNTIDEYYESNVRFILTTVVEQLKRNPTRRFTYVEVAFFDRWWSEQTDSVKQDVRDLVAAKQLEFANGGWCMPDEASPTYRELLMNMQRGLRLIVQQFGLAARPRVAWSIDPFGHSSAYAAMNAEFGYSMSVVGRIDWQEKAARFRTLSMEAIWQPYPSSPSILTHVLDPIQFYSYPPGFNFEGDVASRITPENIESRAQQFASFIRAKAAGYATNTLLVPFGSDFQYTNASINYDNMDLLMAHINANSSKFNCKLRWSTPGTYMDTIHSKNVSWPVKVDDFESYAIGPAQFLVGFYSSRPDLKGFVRRESTRVRTVAADLALALFIDPKKANLSLSSEMAAIDVAVRAVSVIQHHDGITSTQRHHVHHDYIRMLSEGQESAGSSEIRITEARLAARSDVSVPQGTLFTCYQLNESRCTLLEAELEQTGAATIVIKNSGSSTITTPDLRIPVPDGKAYEISTATGARIDSQLVPAWPQTPHVLENGTLVAPRSTLAFTLPQPLSGLAQVVLFVKERNGFQASSPLDVTSHQDFVLENDILRVTFDPQTGLLSTLTRKDCNTTAVVKQEVLWYNASDGSDGPWAGKGATGSGNYIFQPAQPIPNHFVEKPTLSFISGQIVSEARQTFVPGQVEQIFRLSPGHDFLEIEYRIGPLNTSDGRGREVISRFSSDIPSIDKFSTDGNGGPMYERTRNSRAPLWSDGPRWFECTDVVACNYFPTTTAAWIQGDGRRLTVLTDRGQGATSMASGELELMLHRRLTTGCRWGMCENGEKAGLNDALGAEVVIKHWIGLDTVSSDGSSPSRARERSRELNSPPALLFGRGTVWPFPVELTAMQNPLHDAIELTTLEAVDGGLLVRLTHIYPPKEHPELSGPVTVNLALVFPALARLVSTVTEMYASGDVSLDAVQRLEWRPIPPQQNPTSFPKIPPTLHALTLNPGQTRTFMLKIQSRKDSASLKYVQTRN